MEADKSDIMCGTPRAQGSRWEDIFISCPTAICVSTLDGRFAEVNPAWEKMTGYSREEAIGRTGDELSLWVEPRLRSSVYTALNNNESVRVEAKLRSKSGEIKEMLLTGKMSVINGTRSVVTVGHDISARRRAETAQSMYLAVLKLLGADEPSEQVITGILEYIRTALGIESVGLRLERDGDFPFFGTSGFKPDFVAAERTLCMRAGSGNAVRGSDGKPVLECTCGAVLDGKLDQDLPCMTKGKGLWFPDVPNTPKDTITALTGQLVNFRGRCVKEGFRTQALLPLRSGPKTIGLLHLADHRPDKLSRETVEFLEGLGTSIAVVMARREAEEEKSRLEAQMRQAQKMESIGRLAGGVAHDFNNLLTAISGYGSILLRSLDEKDPRRADLREILAAAERGSGLTAQLLAFSRKQVLRMTVVDLNAAVEGSVKLLERLIGEDIKLETDLAKTPCLIRSDFGQIGQVIMNLAVNARDAMPGGGKLSISTRLAQLPAGTGNAAEISGPVVELRAADTGCGMTEEVRQHIFEPFFTTKEKGKGTGLGLSTVYGIVKQCGGTMRLESEPGKGSDFIIYFPQAAPAAEAAAGQDAAKPTARTAIAGRRVVLVEDEDQLLRLGERILREAGYAVQTFHDGKAALAELERTGGADALVTDLLMPGMNGVELANEAKRRGLVTRVLYISGHTDTSALQLSGEVNEAHLVCKPFTAEELTTKLNEIFPQS